MAISAARIFLEAEKRKNDQLRADLRKLAEDLKDTSQEEDFKEYVLYRIEKLLDGGE